MATQDLLRGQLERRRERLESSARYGRAPELETLLREVDAALARFEDGSYGLCEACHDTIEADRLLADPLVRLCLDHLSERERRDLERDLETAGRIQEALLPRRDLVVPGWRVAYHYQPAGPVSGDYCDLVAPSAPGGELHLAFGDVAGKGVAASLLMASLQAMFRSLVAVGLPLGELVERANRLFCESTLSNSYATLVCARAAPSGRVEIVNAGHCPPLVARAGEVEPLPADGLPLGLFCDGRFAPRTALLRPGDTLLFYTDGLSEAEDGDGREYGAERAAQVLGRSRGRSAADTLRACLDDLASFRAGAPLHDDLTVMALERT